MLSWRIRLTALASAKNRSTRSRRSLHSRDSTLIATRLPIVGCTPLYTRPMPPTPSRRATRYAPIVVPSRTSSPIGNERRAVGAAVALHRLRGTTLGAHEHAHETNTRPSECRWPPGRCSADADRNRATSPRSDNGARRALARAHDYRGSTARERLWSRGVTMIGDEELLVDRARHRRARSTGTRGSERAGQRSGECRGAVACIAARARAGHRRWRGTGARIAAAFELGRRAIESEQRRRCSARPEDVFGIVAPRVAGLSQELFFVIGVDIRNGLLDVVEVARGSVHGVEVHPREVFRPLVRMAAAGGVIAHNHPSGDPTPSAEDIALTRRLRAVGDVIGIPIIDHVVSATASGARSPSGWASSSERTRADRFIRAETGTRRSSGHRPDPDCRH